MPLKVVGKTDHNLLPVCGDIDHLTWFEGNLLSTDSSGSLKTWSPDLKLLDHFNPHGEYPVYHLVVDEPNKRLFTCSSDAKIIEWKREDEKWVKVNTLEGHEDQTIRRLSLRGKELFSGDEAGKVNVWENGQVVATFDLMEEIWDMLLVENTMITVRNRDVVMSELIDSSQEKYRVSVKQVLPGRPPLHLAGNRLCFADRNGMTILVVNEFQTSSPKINMLQGHKLIVNAMTGTNTQLFSGGWEKKVIKNDLEKLDAIGEEVETDGYINAMTLKPDSSGSLLYVAGENGFINIIQVS